MHLSVIELTRIPPRGTAQLSEIRWGFETTSIQALKKMAQRIGLHARGVNAFITSFLILVSLSD